MKILKGRGRGARGGGGVVDCGAWSLAVPLEDYEGEIHLGVRPEHVGLCPPDQGTGVADVRVVEPLGPETLGYLDAGGQPRAPRVPGFADPRSGARTLVHPHPPHLTPFAPAPPP